MTPMCRSKFLFSDRATLPLPTALLMQLQQAEDALVLCDLSQGSIKNFHYRLQQFFIFCTITNNFPICHDIYSQQSLLCSYSVYLALGGLQLGTIISYAQGTLSRLHMVNGIKFDSSQMPRYQRLKQGLKRVIPVKKKVRHPLTPAMLTSMVLAASPTSLVDCCWVAAALTAWFCCRRLGEVCSRTVGSFDPMKHLCNNHLLVLPDRVTMTWPTTKTRQSLGNPLVITVARQPEGAPLCLWRALNSYLHHPGAASIFLSPGQPLFQRVFKGQLSGQVLLKDMFVKSLRSRLSACCPELNPLDYSGHSFRIGCATYLTAQGVDLGSIKNLGDWLSDAVLDYIRSTEVDQMQVSLL